MERSALVTGGASGLGRAAALALKARGYKVVVLDLSLIHI
jgi:NAD(P)-dependent dehydrogenase (short-subunit alcohol dehydrogenase family)